MSRLRFSFRSQSSASIPAHHPNGTSPTVPGQYPAKDSLVSDNGELEEENPWPFKGKAREDERLWGLENFGNTCYCNSVLQALYACDPFRRFVESYPDVPQPIWPMAPPPGTADKPLPPKTTAGDSRPGSPLATTKGNPFDSPSMNGPTSPTLDGRREKKGLFGRRSTSGAPPPSLASIQQQAALGAPPPSPTPKTEEPSDLPINFDPNRPPPSMFEAVQTLFHHLSASAPHQPLPARKEKNQNADTAQTASILPPGPTANGTGPQPSLTTSSSPSAKDPNKPDPNAGPPLLASLPPPSAPRGGGPFQAGTLGRGVVRPEDLLKTVKQENDMFRGMSQQDAHEFLGWLLNKVAEDVEMVDRSLRGVGKEVTRDVQGGGKTFVQSLFEGTLVNETRCLSCESTSSRDELFLDLSIDIEQHTSVTACLRQFSASEMLCQKNKFYCDSCCGLQEAEKRMKIKRLPNVLALHLKRFKYQENLGRYTKLFYRVPFPIQLRLPNTSDESENPDRLYELFAVVVHIGNGPHHGHYVSLVRSAGRWVMCDDENVEPIDDKDIFRYFGDYPSGAGYVLFYQAVDLDLGALGLKAPPTPPSPPPAPAPAHEPMSPSTNLMDIDEEYTPLAPVNGVHTSQTQPTVSPRTVQQPQQPAPLQVDVPTIAPPAPRLVSIPAQPKPAQPNPAQAPSPSAVKREDSDTTTTFGGLGVSVPTTMHGEGAEGVMATASPPASTPTPTPTPPRQHQTVTLGTPVNGAAPADLSSSVISTSSSSGTSHLTGSLGRKPSAARYGGGGDRERTVSASSERDKKEGGGGGGLSRRLSGMGKLGKSGSMKFGFGIGKKDKA